MFDQYGHVTENANLKQFNTYKLDSSCKYLIIVSEITKLKQLIKKLKDENIKYFVIGNGSNLILPKFYAGAIIKLDLQTFKLEDGALEVGASYMMNKLGLKVSSLGYVGLEWASGIPGTLGGSLANNSGCYGGCITDDVLKVDILKDGEFITLLKDEFDYSYRSTSLRTDGSIILKVYFKLEKEDPEKLLALIKERNEKRITSQPIELPSAGSVFRNPEGDSAGRMIDELGLKGKKIGGAMISLKHGNFIVNYNNAKTEDIINLIDFVLNAVYKEYGIKLKLEQEIIES